MPNRRQLVRNRRAGLGSLSPICRGGYQPPESLLPGREKVPSVCEADEGGFRNSKIPPAGRPVSGPYERTGCFRIRRRGGCPHPPARFWGRSPLFVGAAISRPKAFSLPGIRCRAHARRMRVGAGMAEAPPASRPVSGPYERTGCFCTCRRGGCPHPPAPECSALHISLPFGGKVPQWAHWGG